MNDNFQQPKTALELFHDGESVRAYELLGAHKVNWDNREGVVFRVWAPKALSVSVIGPFNNWDNTLNYMYKIGDRGMWEVFIEGVGEFDRYKFCIETPWFEKIIKSDPYAFHTETRPDNASIVYDIDKYCWNDAQWLDSRQNSDLKSMPINVYEIHAGSWRKYADGNFFSYIKLADEIVPYVKEMGYNYIEIMPITEYPLDDSWGYQVTGYFAPTSRYGEPEGLMYFIDKCHQNNIGVILDWVPAHFPKDEYGLARFDGTECYEYSDVKKAEHKQWGTYVFDYSKKEVVSFLISSAMFWIDKFHFDGIRVDAVASMLYLDYNRKAGEWDTNKFGGKEHLEAVEFIQKLNLVMKTYHPQVMMIAEESTSWPMVSRPVEAGGLGFDYKWNMGWMNDMLHYMSLDPLWRPFNHDNLTFSFFYAFSENFMLPISHDEVVYGKHSMLNKMPGDFQHKLTSLRLFCAYMMVHPGKKLNFMGYELAAEEEWNFKEELNWGLLEKDEHKTFHNFVKDLNNFYLNTPSLYERDFTWEGFSWVHHDDYANSIIAFRRIDKQGDYIVAVCNFKDMPQEQYIIGVPDYGLYSEIFSTDSKKYGGSGKTNGSNIATMDIALHGCEQGIKLDIPPLSVSFYKCVTKVKKPVREKSEKKKAVARKKPAFKNINVNKKNIEKENS